MRKAPRPKKVKLTTTHVVYVVVLDEETIYVGSGINGREQHCTSGCSNVFGLNELYFKGIKPTVTVVNRCDSKEDADRIEVDLIKLHKPKFNKRHNPYNSPAFKEALIKRWDLYFKTLGAEKRKRYNKIIKILIKNYPLPVLLSKIGVDFSKMKTEDIKKQFSCVFTLLRCRTKSYERYAEHHRELYELFVTNNCISIPEYTPICNNSVDQLKTTEESK